jgi:hypothetical protein
VPVMLQDSLGADRRAQQHVVRRPVLDGGGGAHPEGLRYFASFSCPARLPL